MLRHLADDWINPAETKRLVFAAFMGRFFMAITRQKKEEILKNLEEDIKQANIIVFVNFHGLSVLGAMELRRILKQISAKYIVAKKTIISPCAVKTC